MKNKYLLSVLLCLLSASAAQASPDRQQFDSSNNKIKFIADLRNYQTNAAVLTDKPANGDRY